MSLIEKIKQDQLAARKAKFTVVATVLTTLIGEADAIGKNAGNRQPTDVEVVAILKKFIKNLDEVIKVAGDYRDSDACDRAWDEKVVLQAYLPTQLCEPDLTEIIARIFIEDFNDARDPKLMGKVLGSLKAKYNGMYDGGMASKIVKEFLSK